MNRTRYLWLCVMTAVLLGAWFVVRAQAPRQPAYHGRTLAEWLIEYEAARSVVERIESSNAVERIGTNAIAPLLDWVRDEAPAGAGPRYSSGARPAAACTGFRILGERGRCAVPALIELSRDPDASVRHNAIWCLMEAIPPDRNTAVSVLTARLCDSDDGVRRQAKLYLDRLDPCVPARCLF
jgi:HEAT repeat protein